MRRGEYSGLFTDTEVNNYISIYQTSESVKKKIRIFVFLCLILKIVNKLGSRQLICVSVTISASLVKLRRRMMFKSQCQ